MKNRQAQSLVHSKHSENIPSFSIFHLTGKDLKEMARWALESWFYKNSTDSPCVHEPKDVSYSLYFHQDLMKFSSRFEFQISVFCLSLAKIVWVMVTIIQTEGKNVRIPFFHLLPVGTISLYTSSSHPAKKIIKNPSNKPH